MILAEGIATALKASSDMVLVDRRVLSVTAAEARLPLLPFSEPCALVLVGPVKETAKPAEDSSRARADLVVLRVNSGGDVRIGATLQGLGLAELLVELRTLVEHAGRPARDRIQLVQVQPAPVKAADANDRPLLVAGRKWIHAVLRHAVDSLPEARGDLQWFTLTRATMLHELDMRLRAEPPKASQDAVDTEAALAQALAAAQPRGEPLATASTTLGLTFLEFRVMLLALAPELDPVYQRCVGLLLDDMGRRVGTLGLYASLLGDAAEVRAQLGRTGNLGRWRLLDGSPGALPPADEPLRLDPAIAGWLLGKRGSLAHDARVRRALRLAPWPGASLLDRQEEHERAARLALALQGGDEAQWLLLGGDDAAGWRALLELGAAALNARPIRVEIARFAALDIIDLEECGVRLGRMARLTGDPLVIDATAAEDTAGADDWQRLLLAALGSTATRAALISGDEARFLGLLGAARHRLYEDAALGAPARITALRSAADGADTYLTQEAAETIAAQLPLQVDALEQAMRLAVSRPLDPDAADPRLDRFVRACREVAAKGVSRLAERIESVFSLDDVVLPPDRKQQLVQIVDSIRLAPRVLDEWKFGAQLPYGRGVAALFHGPSGTGKTMAAMGVARRLGIQILRIDLSRVVSKYIGDTEKNIDRVFSDAQRSGSAILIDEADALLGKRSEVKDAHDRYANIEVAYLLQRMEAYEGLAILTTNLRQNLDTAFLRRLRFIVDFPRPDAEAREKIWRRCLPEGSHVLGDADFRQLARRIDLTGGHIRQITLRAAFIAAAADERIQMHAIAAAAEAEFAKLGMPPVSLDLGRDRKAA